LRAAVRARRNAPFPWIVLSHGTAPTAAANRALGRYRPLAPVREWVQRGYAVVAGAVFSAMTGTPLWTAAVASFFRS